MLLPGLLLWLSAHPSPADLPAEAAKGASLLRGCQAEVRLMDAGSALDKVDTSDLVNGAYCVGYLNGFLTGIKPGAGSICLESDNMGDLVRAYVLYMERNPQLGEEDKRVGLRRALESAFPCPFSARPAAVRLSALPSPALQLPVARR